MKIDFFMSETFSSNNISCKKKSWKILSWKSLTKLSGMLNWISTFLSFPKIECHFWNWFVWVVVRSRIEILFFFSFSGGGICNVSSLTFIYEREIKYGLLFFSFVSFSRGEFSVFFFLPSLLLRLTCSILTKEDFTSMKFQV